MATLTEALLSQWHPTLNLFLTAEDVRGRDKVWWVDDLGHEWRTTLDSRNNGSGCPYCANRKLLIGFNDFATVHPELALQWHPTKNVLTSQEIFPRSPKMAWWIDEHGHEWQATPANRTAQKPTGCPYCSRNKLLVGFNDLETLYPEVAAEWHPTKNGMAPNQISAANGRKTYWWVCNLGHEYEALVSNRTAKNATGCPYCSGNKLLVGFNDLLTTHPELLVEWHPTKNEGHDPMNYTRGSTYRAWWKCERNHEWDVEIYHRTGHRGEGRGCPKCAFTVSKEEQVIFNELALKLPSLQDNQMLSVAHNKATWARVDMLLPAPNHLAGVIVEYDGSYWHRDKAEMDRNKSVALIQAGYKVLRLRELPLPSLGLAPDSYVEVFFPTNKDLRAVAMQAYDIVKRWTTNA